MTVTLWVDATPSGPALLLRPWRESDLDALIEAHDDAAIRHWLRRPVRDQADAARWLEAESRGWRDGQRLGFAVCEDPTGTGGDRPVAHVVLNRAVPDREFAQVGYWTAARARGRGVAARAVEALTGWVFDSFAGEGLNRLDLLHQVDNLASCRVAEKAGYAFDRVLPARPPFPLDGHLHVRWADARAR
ncbi:GNAT family N-acetyltransferase [Rugosimonospora acidiphila]|uniref:GNAT family N-acetyltransferase n=1 Tax=Rugosimonospora acidiphila TaxID=556531 RepID=A0ABP9S376_9ACTN